MLKYEYSECQCTGKSKLGLIDIRIRYACIMMNTLNVNVLEKVNLDWLIYELDMHASWWRHQMETISASLALCAGNSLVNGEFPAQGSVTRSLMFSLICVWINDCVNNREAGELRRHRGHYDVIVIVLEYSHKCGHLVFNKTYLFCNCFGNTFPVQGNGNIIQGCAR